jgi:2-haloacid dehalogenase
MSVRLRRANVPAAGKPGDLRALDPHFEQLLGSGALRAQWFAQVLQLSFVGGLTGAYVDFGAAQRAA